MEQSKVSVDYYDVLQVDPGCDARILELAYHHLAKIYHPDHVETSDVDKFNSVVEAYRVLRDPEKRAEYDKENGIAAKETPTPRSPIDPELQIDDKTALDDAEAHETILLHLYKRRREQPSDPGILGWLLQEALGCTDEQFEFHAWYLRSKGFIEVTEQTALAITIEGVDHIIATGRRNEERKLLTKHAEETDEG
ncbi:J domain-containing protein [Altererythrobacter sp. MF3-039]|uniref:J domain-containing protein n=1 Tax=Altererythrobacter sp. MF3-039 TaxID=3252901 RepID=UPI00390CA5D9